MLRVKQFAVFCKDVEEMMETAVKELGLEMKMYTHSAVARTFSLRAYRYHAHAWLKD